MNSKRYFRVGSSVVAALGLTMLVLGLFTLTATRIAAEPMPLLPERDVTNTPHLKPVERPQALQAIEHPPVNDLACESCHSDTTAVVEFPSGETMPVQVDLAILAQSVHGENADDPLQCFDCHVTINDYQYPHTPVTADDLRQYQNQNAANCERCHSQPHLTSHPGSDEPQAVSCTDCHGGHDVEALDTWTTEAAASTCAACHEAADVPLTDTTQLDTLITNGLFAEQVDDDYCLACHSQPGLTMTFANGDSKSITVDADAFHASAHGTNNAWDALQCTDCHTDYAFPHEPVTAESARDYALAQNQLCESCHVQYFEKSLDSVHGAALQEGNKEAAVCTDCHGAHDTPIFGDAPRVAVSQSCEQCHSTIFNEYAESVHGEALIGDDNADVPNCIDCHGVHDIHDPTTAAARARSPELCAGCHADEELMNEYDISTAVFDSYVSDFHGTTIALFDYEHDEVPPNTAVCYDCHGVHSIKAPDDPHANLQENLVENCQQCHPDATTNFADSWLGHYEPSFENFPIIFLVDLFYTIVIPLTLGFFTLMIATDIIRRIRERRSRKQEA